MKKARTLLAIWLALILTLTLFPTALATGDGTEPDNTPAPSTYTISLQYDSNAIQAPTQSVKEWTVGKEAPNFTFTLSDGYDKPTATVTIGTTAVEDAYTLTGPDGTGKYTLTLKTEKINGNVGVSLSAAKVEEPSTPPATQGDDDGNTDPSSPQATYTITYKPSNGVKADNIPSAQTNIAAGTTVKVSEQRPTASFWLFDGWYDEQNHQRYNPGQEIVVNSDITLTATFWKQAVDISFADGTDGAGGVTLPESTTVSLSDGSYILPAAPTRAGYVFVGWQPKSTYTGIGNTLAAGETYTFTETDRGYAVTFTAQWSKGLTVNYDIGTSYNPGGGPKSGEVVDVTKPYTIPKDEPRRSSGSYEFGSWTLNINGKTYQPGATINWDKVGVTDATASVTFTANWSHMTYPDKGNDDKPSKPSKPTYDEYRIRATCSDGGWVSPAGSTYVREGRNLTVTFAPYKGYAIDGVYIDGVLDNRYDGSYTFRDVDENHTIYVRYVRDSGSSGGSSGGGSHWDDNTSPKTGDASAPLSMGLGVGSLALIAFLVARKMRRA